jgi:hypothetical protein
MGTSSNKIIANEIKINIIVVITEIKEYKIF